MMNIKGVLLHLFMSFLRKRLQVEKLKMRTLQAQSYLRNCTNQLLETLRKKSTITFYG